MAASAKGSESDQSADLRRAMVERLKNLGLVRSEPVEEVLRAIPRHLFVPHIDVRTAYNDEAVVTHWQGKEAISSASAPSIVALMLELLDLRPGQRVLEIGAGTGYNAALMGRLVGERGQVVTIDLDDEIVQEARAHIQVVGVENVQVICSDGALGWAEGAPYDKIILTASVADLAPAWHEQLRPGGRLVGPLRLLEMNSKLTEPWLTASPLLPDQFLLAFEWTGQYFESRAIAPCVFVPLRGDFSTTVREMSEHDAESGLSANFSAGIEARSIFELLHEPAQDEATEVHLAFQELFGLRIWLALREERFCEIYVPESSNMGAIPAYLRRDKTFSTALGLCEVNSCSLLKLEEEAEGQPVDPKRPFHLVIRHFGQESGLAGHLREQVEAWERAGHPFVWSMDGLGASLRDIQLVAFPLEVQAMPEARDYDTILTRPYTRFVFTPQASGLVGAEKSGRVQAESAFVPANEHLELLKLGKERWNQWRKEHPGILPGLVACDLSGWVLKELDLRGARFNGANLARADLFGADLSGADLRGANLSQVRAANTNLSGANLSGADLREIFLVKARLNGARLCGVNLEEARLKNTALVHAHLGGANLNFAHLNRVDLEGVNLSGASLMGLDMQETYLPDLDARGDQLFTYRQHVRQLSAPEIEEGSVIRDFAVGQQPLLVLEEMAGNLHIQGWDQPVIRVTSAFELPSMRQEQNAVFIQGGEHDLTIFVPHIPHGLLKLVQHGSSSITTAVTVTDIRGNITIEESGRVEMRAVAGQIRLDAIAGDVVLNRIHSWAMLRQIMGKVEIRQAARVLIENCRGSLTAEHITEILYCGVIGGSCILSACQQAQVSIGWIGGSAWLEGRISGLDCHGDGNIELHCIVESGRLSRVVAGGNLSLYLPARPDLVLDITAGGTISGDPRSLPAFPDSNFVNLVYGSGQARLDIIASGRVEVLSEIEDG